MTTWPDYAAIGGDYAARPAPQTERATFDDGAVRQARIASRPVLLRDIVAHIPGARLGAFRDWAHAHAHAWFAWADPGADGAVHSARVVGGAHGIAYRQTARAGAPDWEARMTLEGPPADASIWDAPVGDDSHVYQRLSAARARIARQGAYDQYRFLDSRRGAAAPLPSDAPAWVNLGFFYVRRDPAARENTHIVLRLGSERRPDPWDHGIPGGPDLPAWARDGLAVCLRAGDRLWSTQGIGGGHDTEDPYGWTPAGDDWPAFRAAAAALRAPVAGAVVWAGAGSVVDLARQTTRFGGAAPAAAQ